jgi:sulfite exporter TauE/SafE
MAIISCPECGKKISSKAAMCPYCGFTTREVTEQELDVFRARRQRDKLYHLNMISYAVITVFVGGFGWYWWDSGGFQRLSSPGPFILMGLAAVAYLVVRALLFRNRRKLKALRKKIT